METQINNNSDNINGNVSMTLTSLPGTVILTNYAMQNLEVAVASTTIQSASDANNHPDRNQHADLIEVEDYALLITPMIPELLASPSEVGTSTAKLHARAIALFWSEEDIKAMPNIGYDSD